MSSDQPTVDFICTQIANAGDISHKKMFGEYGIYCDGKMPALVCDDQLYIKITTAGREFVGEIEEGSPYPGAKPCFVIAEERWEEISWLTELIKITAKELPIPKKKMKK